MTHHPVAMSRRLAEWIAAFGKSEMNAETADRARAILLDSLGCALFASADDKAAPILRAAPGFGGGDTCTVFGTRMRASLPATVFLNGSLIRLLDLNDSYIGPRQVGHPSDNIAAAVAAAEAAKRSGKDLLQAIRLGYEVYGRLLDMGAPESPWDHVTASGLVTAAMTGWLLRLPLDRLTDALALSAMHCATLGEVRVGKISGAKSIANAVVGQTASLLTLLAAEGITGPEQALEGRRGYANLILDGVDFGDFFKEATSDRLMSVGLKQFPCFALGQGPISAALELREKLPHPEALEKLTVVLANTGPARLRLSDEHGRMPNSSEAADHSIYFLVAVALLDGRFGLDQLRAGRWQDRDVRELIARMEAKIDASLQPLAGLPCRLEAAVSGEHVVIERPVTPGSASHPLTWEEVATKFRKCARDVLDEAAQSTVINCVRTIEDHSSIDELLRHLVPTRSMA